MEGFIFDIQRFCLNDGPGIRTTVFLKGCNMRCKWCHNPESFQIKPQLSFHTGKCALCGRCQAVCASGVHHVGEEHRVDFHSCTLCGKCVDACLFGALQIYGRQVQASEVIDAVLRDRKYYDSSGGGVTFSGGEPSVQLNFLIALMEQSRQNHLHICLETNGHMPKENLQALIPYVDLWLFDYKATGAQSYKELTGVDDAFVLENLKYLNDHNCEILLRCPVISGINATTEHFDKIKALKKQYRNIIDAEIMPYHNFGTDKWRQIGLSCPVDLPNTDPEQQEKWKRQIET